MFKISRKAVSLVLAVVFALSAAAFAPVAPLKLSAASAAGTHKVTTGKGDFDVYDSYTVKLKEGGITIAFTDVALRYSFYSSYNPPHYYFYVAEGGTVTFDRDIGVAEKGVPITLKADSSSYNTYDNTNVYTSDEVDIYIKSLNKVANEYAQVVKSTLLLFDHLLSDLATNNTVMKTSPKPALNMSGGDFTVENGELTKYNGKGGAVTIPDGVTVIGKEAFTGCESLTSVTFPNSVKRIDGEPISGAFLRCSSLTSVNFGNGLVEIGRSAFYLCTALKTITIPEGVTEIDYWAFMKCGKLTDVKMADSVRKIGEGAFEECVSLTNVKFGVVLLI